MGETGETYAVDKNGLMVSNCRFDNDLMLLGCCPTRTGALDLECAVRDPGGNMGADSARECAAANCQLTEIAPPP